MQCKDYQRLLHFNRPGELNESQTKILEEHLKVCETCLEKQREINEADEAITRLKKMQPVLSEPAKLTDAIMSEIDASIQKEKSGLGKILDALLDSLTLYQVRVALSLITIFLVGTLLTQQIYILDQVSKLEKKMASGQPISDKYYAIKSSELASIWNPNELRSLVGAFFERDLKSSNDLFFLKKKTVKSWAEKLDKSQWGEKILSKFINKKFLKLEEKSLREALDKIFSKKSDIIDLYKKRSPTWRK